MRLLPIVIPLSLLLAGCGGGDTVTGQVSEVTDGRLCVQTSTSAGLCLSATDEQLREVQVGTCLEVTFSGGGGGVQPVAEQIASAQQPCVRQDR